MPKIPKYEKLLCKIIIGGSNKDKLCYVSKDAWLRGDESLVAYVIHSDKLTQTRYHRDYLQLIGEVV